MTTSTTTSTQRKTQAQSYIESVAEGRILAADWVKKQCQRHLRDLETATERGIYFDIDRAFRPIQWISKSCTITEDGISAKTGQRLRLEPWQQAFLWILFGWRRADGTRRYRNVYAELARGNGKSKLASAIALYVLVGEGTQGSAVYSIATTLQQSKVVFDDSVLMATASQVPELRALLSHQNNLHIPGTATVYRPLASDEHTLDALKPNLIVVDELHAHKTKGAWNKVKTSQGKKPGSMMLAITTAGYDRHSVCFEQRTYAEKVLDGIFDDDSYFAWIQDARDSAKQVTQLYEQAINGLNENLTNLMVGDKSDFAGMFKGIGKTLAGDSLKKIESPILGALGLGKADGSAANPLYVKIASGLGGNAGAGWLAGLTGGGGSDSGKSSGGGFFGKIAGFASSMLGGHYALGGNVKAGVPIDVGEMGRETFTPSVNGVITPHNQVSGGGQPQVNVSVANGVTPEQMEMRVTQMIQQWHPQVVADSVKATRSNQQRNPSSSR